MERDERGEAKRKHSCLPTKRRPEMAALLTLRAIHATAIEVPMARPLGTSAQTMRTAPLLLIDLETEEGITGHAYLFWYTRMAPGVDRGSAGRHPGCRARGASRARRSVHPSAATLSA